MLKLCALAVFVLLFNAGLQCEFNWTFFTNQNPHPFSVYQCIVVAAALDYYSSWFGPISNQVAGTLAAAAAVQSNVHHKIGRSRVRCR